MTCYVQLSHATLHYTALPHHVVVTYIKSNYKILISSWPPFKIFDVDQGINLKWDQMAQYSMRKLISRRSYFTNSMLSLGLLWSYKFHLYCVYTVCPVQGGGNIFVTAFTGELNCLSIPLHGDSNWKACVINVHSIRWNLHS